MTMDMMSWTGIHIDQRILLVYVGRAIMLIVSTEYWHELSPIGVSTTDMKR